jgi:hypothetical protein
MPILTAENIASRDRKSAEIFHRVFAPLYRNTLIPLFMCLQNPNKVTLGICNTRGLSDGLTICIFLLLYEETKSPAKIQNLLVS